MRGLALIILCAGCLRPDSIEKSATEITITGQDIEAAARIARGHCARYGRSMRLAEAVGRQVYRFECF